MEQNGKSRGNQDFRAEEQTGDHYLPTIALMAVPHPKIPNLFQQCFEYLEPWDWSPVTELVETGRWFYANSSGSQPGSGGE